MIFMSLSPRLRITSARARICDLRHVLGQASPPCAGPARTPATAAARRGIADVGLAPASPGICGVLGRQHEHVSPQSSSCVLDHRHAWPRWGAQSALSGCSGRRGSSRVARAAPPCRRWSDPCSTAGDSHGHILALAMQYVGRDGRVDLLTTPESRRRVHCHRRARARSSRWRPPRPNARSAFDVERVADGPVEITSAPGGSRRRREPFRSKPCRRTRHLPPRSRPADTPGSSGHHRLMATSRRWPVRSSSDQRDQLAV